MNATVHTLFLDQYFDAPTTNIRVVSAVILSIFGVACIFVNGGVAFVMIYVSFSNFSANHVGITGGNSV